MRHCTSFYSGRRWRGKCIIAKVSDMSQIPVAHVASASCPESEDSTITQSEDSPGQSRPSIGRKPKSPPIHITASVRGQNQWEIPLCMWIYYEEFPQRLGGWAGLPATTIWEDNEQLETQGHRLRLIISEPREEGTCRHWPVSNIHGPKTSILSPVLSKCPSQTSAPSSFQSCR